MKIRRSIRVRLTLSFVLVAVVTASLSILLGYKLIFDRVIQEAQAAVLSHMNMSQSIYDDRVDLIRQFVDHLASLDALRVAIRTDDRARLESTLAESRQKLGLDILNVTDGVGRVLARGRNRVAVGDSVADDPFIRSVLTNGDTRWGTGLVDAAALQREGVDLAQRARIDIVETPHAEPTTRRVESRGLVLKAAAPVYEGEELVGVVYGATLLNRNFDLVDRIQQLVFGGEQHEGRDVGNATVFLEDTRISTNVRRRDGSRALGTQVSSQVYQRVVESGEPWIDEAFVVERWYISAYNPIFGLSGDVVGILYVGVLRDKYDEIRWEAGITYVVIILFSASIAVLLSFAFGRRVYGPYRALLGSTQGLAEGTYSKIEVESDDEVGHLAATYNQMIEAIQERDRKLLEQTQRQLGQSEKLASLGRLSAGIAHEINNPLTGILTFSNLLKEDLAGSEYEADLQTIIDETLRCRKIVRGILEFARETRLERESANINHVLRDVISLLERHVHFQNIDILTEFCDQVPDQPLDVNMMKSVVNNLAVNAADAMPAGGTLTISTHYLPETGIVRLTVEDTGTGIAPENLERIFDPFFTTKAPGEGTGLGMAVTYGIVRRHDGTIDVDSTVGAGTRITINLPVIARADGESPHGSGPA